MKPKCHTNASTYQKMYAYRLSQQFISAILGVYFETEVFRSSKVPISVTLSYCELLSVPLKVFILCTACPRYLFVGVLPDDFVLLHVLNLEKFLIYGWNF